MAKEALSQLSILELRRELVVRAGGHGLASIGHEVSLGGDARLAECSSRAIANELLAKQKALYGTDDRRDLYHVTDAKVLANARAVCSLFRAQRVVDNGDGTSTVQVAKLGQVRNLCLGERFYDQPVGAFCTGFVVARDVIATAGHCVDEQNVTTVRFVFGFRMDNVTEARVRIANTQIYAGVSVLGRQVIHNATDWCLVRLDRPVLVPSLTVRSSGKILDDEHVYVLGHPSGLPLKFADGAHVRRNSDPAVFTANLDTYGGNSGSPVFNANTHEVEGVLVRGATDFVPVGDCMVSTVCPTTGCIGEDCTRVSELRASIPSDP